MSTLQRLLAQGGLKIQAAKGSSASSPATYGFGVSQGQILSIPIASEYEPLTLPGGASDRFSPAVHRTQILPAYTLTTRATPRSLASWMRLVLGSDSTSGSGPYAHAASPAIDLPYHGLFANIYNTAERHRLNDAKVNRLRFAFTEAAPATLDLEGMACSISLDSGAWTATNDETLIVPASTVSALSAIGGTLQIDVDGTSPATEPISAAEVSIMNNLQPVWLASSITPDDIEEGQQTIEGVITLKPGDLDEWQNILTGTSGGTTLRSTALYGAMSLTCQIDANNKVVFAANRVEFMCDFPAHDPAGGPVELPLAFRVIRPVDASAAITVTTTNDLSGTPA